MTDNNLLTSVVQRLNYTTLSTITLMSDDDMDNLAEKLSNLIHAECGAFEYGSDEMFKHGKYEDIDQYVIDNWRVDKHQEQLLVDHIEPIPPLTLQCIETPELVDEVITKLNLDAYGKKAQYAFTQSLHPTAHMSRDCMWFMLTEAGTDWRKFSDEDLIWFAGKYGSPVTWPGYDVLGRNYPKTTEQKVRLWNIILKSSYVRTCNTDSYVFADCMPYHTDIDCIVLKRLFGDMDYYIPFSKISKVQHTKCDESKCNIALAHIKWTNE